MSEQRTPPYRLRIGIVCPPGTHRLARDDATDQGLRRLLHAWSKVPEPPAVVLWGPLLGVVHRFPPEVVRRLALEVRGRAESRWRKPLRFLLHVWLRVSNAICQRRQQAEKTLEVLHERWIRFWHGASVATQVAGFVGLIVVWPILAAICLTAACLWGMAFPFWMADRVFRRVEFRLRRLESAGLQDADCCVWLVPHPFAWPAHDLPAVLLVPAGQRLSAGRLPDSLDIVRPDLRPPRAVVSVFADATPAKASRVSGLPAECCLPPPPWSDGERWLEIFEFARDQAAHVLGMDWQDFIAWPNRTDSDAPERRVGPRKALLVLPIPWGGGNWEHTRELVHALNEIARTDGRLRIELAVHAEQTGTAALPADVPLHRCRLMPILRETAERLGADVARSLQGCNGRIFSFFNGAAEAALDADVWLALSDRFPLPLLPARPYAVVVHDMIHRHVPEAFGSAFFRNLHRGMTPTLRHAEAILTTSPSTRRDVVAAYGIAAERVLLLPLACEPRRRFERLPTGLVPLPRRDFILNVTNASPHKGADLMLQSYAALKQRLGSRTPLLVLCGINTHYLSARCPASGPGFWTRCREWQRRLGLVEGRDVVFLGPVTDIELKDLYQRCQAVVNAARYDNGTYCLIEAAWFGKPAVSTRYPAVEDLVHRFGLPVRFAPLDDAEALADAVASALLLGDMSDAELHDMRRRLDAPDFHVSRYAGEIYRLLLALAERKSLPGQGRHSEPTEAASAQATGDLSSASG